MLKLTAGAGWYWASASKRQCLSEFGDTFFHVKLPLASGMYGAWKIKHRQCITTAPSLIMMDQRPKSSTVVDEPLFVRHR